MVSEKSYHLYEFEPEQPRLPERSLRVKTGHGEID